MPIFSISHSGTALENISSGQVKFGPFILRSFHSHAPTAPMRHAVGPHQLRSAGLRLIFQHFIITCHCSGVISRLSATPCFLPMRVSSSGVKIDGTKKANRPRRSTS